MQEVIQAMDGFTSIALVLVLATGGWGYIRLGERIALLEHEVRWLRQELEQLKPTEVKSVFDPT
mgnify:FL=1